MNRTEKFTLRNYIRTLKVWSFGLSTTFKSVKIEKDEINVLY